MIQQQSYRIITKGIRKYSIGFSSDVPDDLVCWILSQPCMIDYCETMILFWIEDEAADCNSNTVATEHSLSLKRSWRKFFNQNPSVIIRCLLKCTSDLSQRCTSPAQHILIYLLDNSALTKSGIDPEQI